MCFILQDIGTIWLMAVVLLSASVIFHFLVLYCSLRAKKVIDVRYLGIEKIKTAKRIEKLYGFQSRIPSLTMNEHEYKKMFLKSGFHCVEQFFVLFC